MTSAPTASCGALATVTSVPPNTWYPIELSDSELLAP